MSSDQQEILRLRQILIDNNICEKCGKESFASGGVYGKNIAFQRCTACGHETRYSQKIPKSVSRQKIFVYSPFYSRMVSFAALNLSLTKHDVVYVTNVKQMLGSRGKGNKLYVLMPIPGEYLPNMHQIQTRAVAQNFNVEFVNPETFKIKENENGTALLPR